MGLRLYSRVVRVKYSVHALLVPENTFMATNVTYARTPTTNRRLRAIAKQDLPGHDFWQLTAMQTITAMQRIIRP